MKNIARIIKTNGDIIEVEPKNGTDFKLDELKEAIGGGYIEVVRLPDHKHLLIIDEEGKLKGMPVNVWASRFYGNPHDLIVGDALFCHNSQVK